MVQKPPSHQAVPAPRSRKRRIPDQRWEIAPAKPHEAAEFASATGLSPLLAQVMLNRGIEDLDEALVFLDPELQELPLPTTEFADLDDSLDLLVGAIEQQQPIAICGDYDADGMTSTALLLRALRSLGADVRHAIPSRMSEGYGINERIVEEFHQEGVQIVLTVDNGIAARKPIERAKELGLIVIITDHHDLPDQLPPADAILNPKQLKSDSPYCGLAGVGVAYILAVCLAHRLDQSEGLAQPLLELFTLGTIADLAPLVGINRRWLQRGLRLLPNSQLPGVRALIQVAGLGNDQKRAMKPEDIGFRLGPRINAVGRIGDPQVVIELLTADDEGEALERAMQCEQINEKRQELCRQIEQEAIAWFEESDLDLRQAWVLVVVQPEWHHGVIGIVASRLVERYGVPVFIGTYEDEDQTQIRGSARGIREFNVFEALQACDDLLGKYGGHRAAGGFSFPAENLETVRSRLSQFAHQTLELEHLKPLVCADVQANLSDISLDLYRQIDRLHPCGIGNPDPVFWTANVRVLEQKLVGKSHLKLLLGQDALTSSDTDSHTPHPITPSFKTQNSKLKTQNSPPNSPIEIRAIAWRWGEYCPLPNRVDLAYRLRENSWNGNTSVELEIVGVRLPNQADRLPAASTTDSSASFSLNQRQYSCRLTAPNQLEIQNDRGDILVVQQGEREGQLSRDRAPSQTVNVSQPPFYAIVKAAVATLTDIGVLSDSG